MSFINYIFKKLFYVLLVLITIVIVSFFSVKQIPSDPVTAAFGQKGPTPEQRADLEKKLGLDKPTSQQFLIYLKNILKFNFGNSYKYEDQKTLSLFWKSFKTTLLLSSLSCILGSLIGICFGSLSALWQNSKKSFILEFIFLFLFSTPTFIIGFIFQYYLAYKLKLFDISGAFPLPILTLSLAVSGSIFKITQNNMVDCLKQPYIATAYAKGLSTKTVIFKHALKNAIIPILAQIGLVLNYLISGSVITESIFNLRGVGRLIIDSFHNRDYPIIQCCMILLAIFISVFNLLLDLLYFKLNPKLK
ncbi:ABC transporter permease [Columbia Basin potato purple top phytoplasma]|uniref:ABC transporter permease n=1 Tax=Columbia Basin potato purple top phytoplasma TaxID=307134 RepID=A0ABT5L9X0_9MOLU|nr:ABC transporter permease [Columbia Basin potato purple top phytoplasma]MDC9032061.1 ABC transporter permease [Columbia Basin potato purple top phytoplasma]